MDLEIKRLSPEEEKLVQSRLRENSIFSPRYVTVLEQPELGVEVQIETLTDQIHSYPNLFTLKTRNDKTSDWRNIKPSFSYFYDSRPQALRDHDIVVALTAGTLVDGDRRNLDYFFSVGYMIEQEVREKNKFIFPLFP